MGQFLRRRPVARTGDAVFFPRITGRPPPFQFSPSSRISTGALVPLQPVVALPFSPTHFICSQNPISPSIDENISAKPSSSFRSSHFAFLLSCSIFFFFSVAKHSTAHCSLLALPTAVRIHHKHLQATIGTL